MQNIIVSIAITTYNHEKFISQCIESVLMQKVNFQYEIVIGEDKSTDGTRAICRQIAEKYPDRIRLVENEVNLGLRKNNLSVWSNCKGKYIAYLEGDDFWTADHKLQMQIDYLESNNQYIGSGHQAFLWYGEGLENQVFSTLIDKQKIDFKQNIDKWLFATCTFVFRNFFIDENFKQLKIDFQKDILFWSDRPLMVLLSLYGDFVYHDENLGCWRQHESNMTVKGNLSKMNAEGGMAYQKISKLYPEKRTQIKELALRWFMLAAEESKLNKKYAAFIRYSYLASTNISSFLGLKNYIKSNLYILINKKIYA